MILSSPPGPVTLETAYRAAHESAVVVDHGARGLLLLEGKSRLELLHRMSTQAVKDLQPGEGAATVLTTEIGRMIDRVIVYADDEFAFVLTGEGHADALARYFRRNIFFNDDVRVTDLSAEAAIIGIHGPSAAERLNEIHLDVSGLSLHHWKLADSGHQIMSFGLPITSESVFAKAGFTVHRADPLIGDGYYLIAPLGVVDSLLQIMQLGTTAFSFIDEAAYDYLRIEAGRPRFGRELTLDYIPLEAGLWDDVSFNKGCYTGQEIIARMESRGKLAKRLARLRPASPVAAGAEIMANGRPVGTITSAADGPGGPVALGYVKTAVLDEGTELTADGVLLKVVTRDERRVTS